MSREIVFRKVDGVWERKIPGERIWERLRIEEHKVRRQTIRNVGRNGTTYYNDIEETVKVWVWEPIQESPIG